MLDPQAKTLLDLIASRNMPAVHTQDPVTARAQYRERRFFTQPEASQVDTVRELSADGPHGPIPLRLYRPLPASAGALPDHVTAMAADYLTQEDHRGRRSV